MHTPSLCIFEITLAGKIPGMHYYQHINILRTFLLRPNISWHWKLVLMKFFDCTRNVFMLHCNGILVLRYYIYLFITFLWGFSVSDKYMLAKLSAFRMWMNSIKLSYNKSIIIVICFLIIMWYIIHAVFSLFIGVSNGNGSFTLRVENVQTCTFHHVYHG